VAYHVASWHTDFLQRSIDYKNVDSLKYVYSIASPKLPGNKFATHTDFLTTSYPSFTTGDFHKLSNGGSRDCVLERYLAVVDDAGVEVVTPDGEVKCYPASKRSIVLVEHLADKTFRVSIPHTGDTIDDANAESEELVDSTARNTTV
jgi:hypothetical protein